MTEREQLGQAIAALKAQRAILGDAVADAAQAALAPVLAYLADNPTLNGPEHPYRISLICGEVLLAEGKRNQAQEIVEAGHTRLVAQAERLSPPDAQEQFWQTPEYAALRRLWAELAREKTPDE